MSVSKWIVFLLGQDDYEHHFAKCNPRVGCACQVWCDICSEMHRLDFLHIWQRPGAYPLWLQNAMREKQVSPEEGRMFMTIILGAPEVVQNARIWEKITDGR